MGVYDQAARFATKAEPGFVLQRLQPITGLNWRFRRWQPTRGFPCSKLGTQYGITVLPSIFLVGKDGKCCNRAGQIGSIEDDIKKHVNSQAKK